MDRDLLQEGYSRMNVLEKFQILIMIIVISQFELFSEKSFFLPTVTVSQIILITSSKFFIVLSEVCGSLE